MKRAAQEAIAADVNQYAITWGAKSLRNAIARTDEGSGRAWKSIPNVKSPSAADRPRR
jgi:hypothetical protein